MSSSYYIGVELFTFRYACSVRDYLGLFHVPELCPEININKKIFFIYPLNICAKLFRINMCWLHRTGGGGLKKDFSIYIIHIVKNEFIFTNLALSLLLKLILKKPEIKLLQRMI